MTKIQIKNLFSYISLYVGIVSGETIFKQSEDYLIEKYNKIIGIKLSDKDYKEELNKIPTYIMWKKVWGHKDAPDALLMFLCKSYDSDPKGKVFNLDYIIPIFNEYIGSPLSINTEEYPIHPKLKESLVRIISRKVTSEQLRQIKLNYLVS